MKDYIVIKKYETDEIVKKIDVTNKSESTIEKIDKGININLNHLEYYTDIIRED